MISFTKVFSAFLLLVATAFGGAAVMQGASRRE